jgi:hypothetical protein
MFLSIGTIRDDMKDRYIIKEVEKMSTLSKLEEARVVFRDSNHAIKRGVGTGHDAYMAGYFDLPSVYSRRGDNLGCIAYRAGVMNRKADTAAGVYPISGKS